MLALAACSSQRPGDAADPSPLWSDDGGPGATLDEGAEEPEETVTDLGPPAPAEDRPEWAFLCRPCMFDRDCGRPEDRCSHVSPGAHCTTACERYSDCPAGYECREHFGARQCVPLSKRCDTCTARGCPDGQICNHDTGKCQDPVPICQVCTRYFDCSLDGTAWCNFENGYSLCAPACESSADCPSGEECWEMNTGRKVCTLSRRTCCPGGACRICGCPQEAPHCHEDACVECVEDADCGDRYCHPDTHTCTDDLCDLCVDPYPACVEHEGRHLCVQCSAEDMSYCERIGSDRCDPNTYTCISTPHGWISCRDDDDCASMIEVIGAEPRCWDEGGPCFDSGGLCDGVGLRCLEGYCLGFADAGVVEPPRGEGDYPVGICACHPEMESCFPGSTCVDLRGTTLAPYFPDLERPVCVSCAGLERVLAIPTSECEAALSP